MMIAGTTVSMSAFWLNAMVLLLIIEMIVPGIVSIFFAFGALASLIAALLHAPVWLQLAWFFAVSILTLILTRPFVKKYVNSRVTPTNADMAVGRDAIVTEAIDNLNAKGAVMLDGKIWTARTEKDTVVINAGEIVRILRIQGVKLIVGSRAEQD